MHPDGLFSGQCAKVEGSLRLECVWGSLCLCSTSHCGSEKWSPLQGISVLTQVFLLQTRGRGSRPGFRALSHDSFLTFQSVRCLSFSSVSQVADLSVQVLRRIISVVSPFFVSVHSIVSHVSFSHCFLKCLSLKVQCRVVRFVSESLFLQWLQPFPVRQSFSLKTD